MLPQLFPLISYTNQGYPPDKSELIMPCERCGNALPAIEEMMRELKGLEQTLREQADVLDGGKPIITCGIVPRTRADAFRQTASELRAILEKVGVNCEH